MIVFQSVRAISIATCLTPFSYQAKKSLQKHQFHTPMSQGSRFTFPPTAKVISRYPGLYSTEMMRREIDFFAADLQYSLKHCGPIQKFFLTKLLQVPYVRAVYLGQHPGLQLILDSRTHVLEIDEQPAIPGWHTDFAERTPSTNLQPDYSRITPSVRTYVVNYSDHPNGVSNTEFMTSEVDLILPKERVYQAVDTQLESMPFIDSSQLVDGEIIEMDQWSLHRGKPAHNRGSRGFMRLAILHNLTTTILQTKPLNEQRHHLQSYQNMFLVFRKRNHLQNPLLKNKYEFLPTLQYHETTPQLLEMQRVYTVDEIKSEPMIVNGSLEYSMRYGGVITRKFLTTIIQHPSIKPFIENRQEGDIKINTRVHMLMTGQSSDLSMWRSGAPFQEVIHPDESKRHFLLCLSSKKEGVSDLEFLKTAIRFETTLTPTLNAIQREISSSSGIKDRVGDGQLVSFKGGALHRAVPAHTSGWKLSLLVSFDSRSVQNEIVTQIPVYLEDVSLGW